VAASTSATGGVRRETFLDSWFLVLADVRLASDDDDETPFLPAFTSKEIFASV
jgi:hypothetical protein